MDNTSFDDIRPYYDSELPAALERIPPNFHWLADSALQQGLEKVRPDGSAPEKLV